MLCDVCDVVYNLNCVVCQCCVCAHVYVHTHVWHGVPALPTCCAPIQGSVCMALEWVEVFCYVIGQTQSVETVDTKSVYKHVPLYFSGTCRKLFSMCSISGRVFTKSPPDVLFGDCFYALVTGHHCSRIDNHLEDDVLGVSAAFLARLNQGQHVQSGMWPSSLWQRLCTSSNDVAVFLNISSGRWWHLDYIKTSLFYDTSWCHTIHFAF